MENIQIYERIQILRKVILKMSRKDFAQRLGVSANTIVNIEMNRLARPEQKEPLIRLICLEFNVNEKWLREGIGETFKEKVTNSDSLLVLELLENETDDFYKFMRKLIKTYRESDSQTKQYIKEFCKAIQQAD